MWVHFAAHLGSEPEMAAPVAIPGAKHALPRDHRLQPRRPRAPPRARPILAPRTKPSPPLLSTGPSYRHPWLPPPPRPIKRSLMPTISAACHQLIPFAIARKTTSYTFIARSIAAFE